MHPQLQAVEDEFHQAERRLHDLIRTVPEDAWARRAAPERWSVGECIAHINLTSAAFVPLIRDALAHARQVNGPPPARYRRDPLGWLLWRVMPPPVRFRARTTAPFVPHAGQSPQALVGEFDRLQREQIASVRDADGLPLGRVRIASPFNARVRYNLFSCLTILPRHQHRHLWQAEQVWLTLQR